MISSDAKLELLESLIGWVRRDTFAKLVPQVGERPKYFRVEQPLTRLDLQSHLANDPNIGIYLPVPNTASTKIAALDLDDHKGIIPWPEMKELGLRLKALSEENGLMPFSIRSGGGRGIHLLYRFDQPQPCANVRAMLISILKTVGFRNGSAGIDEKEIEVFPKSDSVADFGAMIALPFGRESVPLGEQFEFIEHIPFWVSSAPPPQQSSREWERPDNNDATIGVAEALSNIPSDDYHRWIDAGHALKQSLGEDGFAIWNNWASKSSKYDGEEHARAKWNSLKPDGRLTIRSIFHWSRGDDQRNDASPRSLPSWPAPLGHAAFHGLAGEVVKAIEPNTEADNAALLIQFLVAFGNSIGRTCFYLIEGDRHFTNLFVTLVGDTSKARKGTSWGRIRQIFELIELDDWAAERVVNGLSTGEGLIHQVRDPVFKAVTDEKTGGVMEVLEDKGEDDKRLFIQASEFASVLRVMQRDGNTLSGVIRDAWDRGNLQTMTRKSPLCATGAHISIVGHITEAELRRDLNSIEASNGFANRFLFISVRRSKLLAMGGMNTANLSDLSKKVGDAVNTARRLGRLTWDKEAEAAWHEAYERLSRSDPGMVGCITARSESQVVRLALLYASIDGAKSIGSPHLAAALEVWRYAEESTKYIFGNSLGNREAEQILRGLVTAGPAGLSGTEISELFGHHKKAEVLERAKALLVSLGLAVKAERQTSGRPVQIYTVADMGTGAGPGSG